MPASAPGRNGFSRLATRKMLETHFDLPINEASEELGVSTTIVKRLCRKFGIKRWPYRQINAINKSIGMLRQVLAVMQTSETASCKFVEKRISDLLEKRETLIRNPNGSPRCLVRQRQTLSGPTSSLVETRGVLTAASGTAGEGRFHGRTVVTDSVLLRGDPPPHSKTSDDASSTPAPSVFEARGTDHPAFSRSATTAATIGSYKKPKARDGMIEEASPTGGGLTARTSSAAPSFRRGDESAFVQESKISGNGLSAVDSIRKRGARGGGEEVSFLHGFSNSKPCWARHAVAFNKKLLANGPRNKRPCLERADTERTFVKPLPLLPSENLTTDNKEKGASQSHPQSRINSTQAQERIDRMTIFSTIKNEDKQQQTPLSTGDRSIISPFACQSNASNNRRFFIGAGTRNGSSGGGEGGAIVGCGTSTVSSLYPAFNERPTGGSGRQSDGCFATSLDADIPSKFHVQPRRQSQGIHGRGDKVVFEDNMVVTTENCAYASLCTASGKNSNSGDQEKANTPQVRGVSFGKGGRLGKERSPWATAAASDFLLVEGSESEIRPTSPIFRMWDVEGAGRSWDSNCLPSLGRASKS